MIAGASALPSSGLAMFSSEAVSEVPKKQRAVVRDKVSPKLEFFPMTQVRLGNGPFQQAQEINRKYLHTLETDRLLHTFRINAGLPSSVVPLGGWEEPKCELRGHFTG